MSVIAVAAGSLLLFLPLAPFLAVLWVLDRLTGSDPGDRARSAPNGASRRTLRTSSRRTLRPERATERERDKVVGP